MILIGSSLVFFLIGVLWKLRQDRAAEQAPSSLVVEPQTVTPPPSAAIPPAPVSEPEPTSAPPPKPDNLKKIKGIGPKISQVLNEEGISTFEQLAATEVEYLHRLMVEREWQIASPDTWPEQARHLADEKRKKQQGAS